MHENISLALDDHSELGAQELIAEIYILKSIQYKVYLNCPYI